MTDVARSHIDVSRSDPTQASVRASLPLGRASETFRTGRRLAFKIIVLVAAVLAVLIGLDFIRFSRNVAELGAPSDIRAEGIVALTGGTARIDGALALLADGRAERLLISGVNPAVTRHRLASTVVNASGALNPSVDLGHAARDTIGNADEARAWAKKNGFHSLIVVTSDYHMPRSMAELSGAMPDVDLLPYPVSNPQLEMNRWWRHAASVKLLLAEYVKYTLARARLALESPRRDGASASAEIPVSAAAEVGVLR